MNVLVVDDDPDVLELVAEMFERIGCHCGQARNISQALQLLEYFHWNLVVTDLNIGDENGYDLAVAVKSGKKSTKVMIMTGSGIHGMHTAEADGIVDEWIFKPFGFPEIIDTLERLKLRPAVSREYRFLSHCA
ncbi:MAG: response regulator [Thermodesulfobacteriota bacterium]